MNLFFRTVLCNSTSTDQNFIIGCQYFLKKYQLPVWTKTLFVAGIFLVIFLFPCDIVVVYVFVLPIKLAMMT